MKVADLRERRKTLGFRPEDAVRWLSPRELWRAGVKVVLSSVFASYADKREVQEALQPTQLEVSPASGELWLDFVADLGDGFDATCTVAGLLAADRLEPGAAVRTGSRSGRCPAPPCSSSGATRSTPRPRRTSTTTG